MLPTPQFTEAYLATLSASEFQAVMQRVLVERVKRESLLDAAVDALTGGLEVQDEVATAEQTLFPLDTTPGLDPDDDPRVQLLINGIESTDFTVNVGAPSLTYTGSEALGEGDAVRIFIWPAATESDPLALQKANNLSDLVSAAAARGNLELGTAATRDVGGANGVAGLDGSGFLDALDARNLLNVPQVDPGRRVVGTGLYWGGHVTINGGDDTQFDISQGGAVFSDQYATPETGPSFKVEFAAIAGTTAGLIGSSRLTYIGIRRDNVAPAGGSATAITVTINGTAGQTAYLVQSPVDFTTEEARDIVRLALLFHPGAAIVLVQPLPSMVIDATQTLRDLLSVFGTLNVSGNEISANGANLKIDVTAGVQLRAGAGYADTEAGRKNINFAPQDARTQATFQYVYRDGSGGYTYSADATDIDPDAYDDGTGVLSGVPANRWSVQRVWGFTSGNLRVAYDQATYATETAALASLTSATFVYDPSLDQGALIGFIIVRGGASDLSDAGDALFRNATRFGVGGSPGTADAFKTAYVPTTPSNWDDPDPENAGDALDDLAEKLATLGGAGATYVEVTAATGSIAAAGGTEDINVALPAGISKCLIIAIAVTRTAGTGTSCSVGVFTDDARATDQRWIFGVDFAGITVDPGPVEGPQTTDIPPMFYSFPYQNEDGSSFIRARVTNRDNSNVATYSVRFDILPLST